MYCRRAAGSGAQARWPSRSPAGRKIETYKTDTLTVNLNLPSEIGATCHIFRDIDVLSAFPLAALLGSTMGKALKTSISRNI